MAYQLNILAVDKQKKMAVVVEVAKSSNIAIRKEEHEKLEKYQVPGRRRGLAILLSGKLHFEKLFEISDKEGRFILVRENIEGNPVTLLNIYMQCWEGYF